MRLTWQNLMEGKRFGLLRHGRAWLQFGHGARYPRPGLTWEWRFGWWQDLRLMVTTMAEERDVSLSIGLGFANLHIAIEGVLPYGDRTVFGLDTGFYLWGDHLVLKWRNDDSAWSSITGDLRGWSKSWFLLDVLLGRAKYTEGEAHVSESAVLMPEAAYPCTITVRQDTWKRPRWPRPRRMWRGTVDVPGGVPVPGKGENSYDCGQDAIYSLTTPAWTAAEAVAKFRTNALRRREKYGGRNWRPNTHKNPHSEA